MKPPAAPDCRVAAFHGAGGERGRQAGAGTDRAGLWVREHSGVWSSHERGGDLRRRSTRTAGRGCVQPQLLGQLLDNLLDNACKYSPAGTPITVEVGREGTMCDAGRAGPRSRDRRRRPAAYFRAVLSLG